LASFSSFRRKPESSFFKKLWTPAFAGVTLQETFYEIINFRKEVSKMKKRFVMLLLAGVIIGGLVFFDSAPQAAETKPKVISWTGQSCVPPGMPVSVGLQDLAERIKAATGGRMVWNPKPAGSVCPATKE
jgi:TRAP-type mannitol/chloroaromatic compound transport system substrate-binding protein